MPKLQKVSWLEKLNGVVGTAYKYVRSGIPSCLLDKHLPDSYPEPQESPRLPTALLGRGSHAPLALPGDV